MNRKRAFKAAVKPIQTGKASEHLAANLAYWLEHYEPKDVATLAKRSGVSRKTIYNMLNVAFDPAGKAEKIAKVYGKEAWMLLCPVQLAELSELILVYSRADERSRHDFKTLVEIIKRRGG